MMSRIGFASLIFLIFFTLLATSIANPARKNHSYKPCKTLVLYFHDIIFTGHNDKNATSYIVAAPEGYNRTVLSTPFRFGDIIIFNDPITLDNNLHSEPVGRAQGMYFYDSKFPFTAWFGFSFALNSTDHVGTISFVGVDPLLQPSRDFSVVGGTGDFFMNRGIATVTTDAIEGVTYFRLKVVVNFYDCW